MGRPLVLFLTLILAGPLLAAPVAVVTELSGPVKITRAGKPIAAQVGLALEAGDRVQAGGGRAVLFFPGGPPKTIAGTASLTVGAATQSGGTWGRVFTGLSRGLSGQSRTGAAAMRPGVVALVYPQNTAILESHPTFIWDDGGAKADQYEITVSAAGGVTLWTARTSQTRLQYPAQAPALSGSLIWQIMPLDRNAAGTLLSAPAKASPPTGFRLATPTEAAQVRAELAQIDQVLAAQPQLRSLARAAALHDRGFLGQALQELAGQTGPTAKQLQTQWLAESRAETTTGDTARIADLPDVELDPARVPEEIRKTYTDTADGFSLQIPATWGVSEYDWSKTPADGQTRDVRLVEFGCALLIYPSVSIAIEHKPQPNPLMPWLGAMMKTGGALTLEAPRRIQFQGRPATATDWTWTPPGKRLAGTSIEFSAGGKNWVISAINTDFKAPGFAAASTLLPTWKPADIIPATPPLTFDALLAEMRDQVLVKGQEINDARSVRSNIEPTRDLAGALKALAEAAPDSREAAIRARIAAGAAGALGWDALQKGDAAAAQRLMAQRRELLARSYASEKAFYLREFNVTDQRIRELSAITPPQAIAEAYTMVLGGWLGVQGFRAEDLALLARDNDDLETREAMARRDLEIKLRLLRMAPFSNTTPDALVDKKLEAIVAFNSLGDAAEIRAEFDLARAYYKRELEMRRALQAPPEKRDEDSPLRDLGFLESRIGNTDTAIQYYQQALAAMDGRRAGREAQIAAATPELQRIMRGEFWQGYNVIYNNLGILVHGKGDYEGARQYYEKAIEVAEKMPTEGPTAQMRETTIARSVANLATLQADSGQMDEAQKSYGRAVEIYKRTGDDNGLAFTMLNLAGLMNEAGDTAGARKNVEGARSLYGQLESSRGKMAADIFLARLERQDGNYAHAEELAQEALGIARAQGDLEYIATTARAVADARRQALAEANPVPPAKLEAIWQPLREAEAADRKSNQITSMIFTAGLRAKVQERIGDLKGAVDSLRPAIDQLEAIRASTKSADAFAEQSSNYEMYEQMVRLLLKLGRTDEAFDYLQRARSKKLQDSLRLTSVKSPDPAVQQLLDRAAALQGRLQTVRAQLADEQARPASEQDPKKVQNLTALVASTQAEFFTVSNQLKDKFPNYEKVVSVKPRELKKAQRTLPAGALLLEYAPLGDELYIFAVTRDDLKIYTPPVEPAVLKAKIREFRQEMDSAAEGVVKGTAPTLAADPATRQTLTALYDMLLKPVADDIAKADVVAIIPTQELFYLPFHALARADVNSPDGLKFFIEEKPVAYLAAADVLSVVQSRDETRLGKGLLALGDPAGAGQPGSLPEARQEVTAIAKLYPAAEVLVGERATKTVLLAPEATQRRALHLAAHGVLDSIQPDRSFIQLAPSGTDDGKLRVGEIYGLNLNAVDLVTLSACRTALGEGNPDGAEITSLAESFSSAGTPTVIASLWSVEDQSTRQLMETFYKEWAAGKPKSACLRTAQLALLQNPATRHPFYWAPFEVLGDWR